MKIMMDILNLSQASNVIKVNSYLDPSSLAFSYLFYFILSLNNIGFNYLSLNKYSGRAPEGSATLKKKLSGENAAYPSLRAFCFPLYLYTAEV